MATVRRLTDSCLVVASASGTSLIDPGFHTFDSGEIDLAAIGDIERVLITHEHLDHVKPEFVTWVLDRGDDVTVHGNDAVATLLARHDIEVATGPVDGVVHEDVLHETTPVGTAPPNRSFTVDGVLTHPGDSYQPATSGTALALGLLVPWGSTRASLEFAMRLAPQQVIPVHDFYLGQAGREWIRGMATRVLGEAGIEVLPLDWGQSATIG
jgi:L-ascorbate metabolism protein UlaG (beta-lactamase superfamily)